MRSPLGHLSTEGRSNLGLYSLPPLNQPLISKELVAKYRNDAKYQPDSARDAELQEGLNKYIGFLQTLSPSDPMKPSFEEISSGFGFKSTIYDKIQGPLVNLIPEFLPQIIQAKLYEFKHLELMTHPSILETRLAMLARGSTGRIVREIPALEELIDANIAIAWKNLGWAINERDYSRNLENSTTTAIRAQGMWSYLSHSSENPLVASVVLGPSHPDLVSSLSLAELALAGCVVFVPCDGTQSETAAQTIMLKTAFKLIDEHPLLALHRHKDFVLSNGQKLGKHLSEEAKKRIGVTLKPYPVMRSIDVAREFHGDFGVEIFRCFDPRDTQELPKVIAGIRNIFPKAHLIASQVTGVESAKQCTESGANSLIMNIGDGGHCKTASGSGMTTSNPAAFYRVQKNVSTDVGIILDGGVGPMALPLSMGASAGMKHGSLIQGTIQHIPCFQAVNYNNEYYKIYSGEAAERNKSIANQLDVAGLPKNVEGVDGAIKLSFCPADIPSLSSVISLDRMLEPIAKAIAFQQGGSIKDLLEWSDPIVMIPTPEAVETAAPHIKSYT